MSQVLVVGGHPHVLEQVLAFAHGRPRTLAVSSASSELCVVGLRVELLRGRAPLLSHSVPTGSSSTAVATPKNRRPLRVLGQIALAQSRVQADRLRRCVIER